MLRPLLLLALPLLLACSGGDGASSDAPKLDGAAYEAAYCGGPTVAFAGDLVEYTGPVQEVPLAVTVQLESDRVIVDGVAYGDASQVRDALTEKADEARAIARLTGPDVFRREVVWAIPPGERAHRVAALTDAARDAGFLTSFWVVETGPPPPQLEPLVPALKAELEEATRHLDGPGGQVVLAELMVRETEGCAEAIQMFEALAFAAVATRCSLLAAGIDEVWAACPRQAPRIVTLLQGMQTSTRSLGAIVTTSPAEASALEVPYDTRWSDVLPQLAARTGQGARLVAPVPVEP